MSEKLNVVKQPGFLKLWIGQSISSVGSQMTGMAIPVIAVLFLKANELEMGFLNAASTSAFLVVGLLAGALVDRWVKRKVMIIADLVRMVAIGVIPILYLYNVLNIYQLIVISIISSVASVFFDVSYQSYIPILLPKEYIGIGNSRLEITSQISGIGGPAIVGALLKVIKAPLLLIFDALSFLVSAFSLLLIKDREVPKPKSERKPLKTEIAEGLKFVWNQRLIRAISFTTSTGNLCTTIVGTMYAIYFFNEGYLHFDTAQYGLLATIGSLGGLLGASLTPKLIKIFGEGPLIVLSSIVMGLAQLLIPTALYLPKELALVVLAVDG